MSYPEEKEKQKEKQKPLDGAGRRGRYAGPLKPESRFGESTPWNYYRRDSDSVRIPRNNNTVGNNRLSWFSDKDQLINPRRRSLQSAMTVKCANRRFQCDIAAEIPFAVSPGTINAAGRVKLPLVPVDMPVDRAPPLRTPTTSRLGNRRDYLALNN